MSNQSNLSLNIANNTNSSQDWKVEKQIYLDKIKNLEKEINFLKNQNTDLIKIIKINNT